MQIDPAENSPSGSRRAVLTGLAGALAAGGIAVASPASAAGPRAAVTDDPVSGAWIDVTAYGATGDGETDDTDAIQAAIDGAPESGAVIVFPPGQYRLRGTLYPRANQTLRDSFPRSIFKALDGVLGFTVFDTRKAGGPVSFDGLVIDGNKANTQAPPIAQPGSTLNIQGSGIHFPVNDADSVGNRVIDCEIRQSHNWGLVAQLVPAGSSRTLQVHADHVWSHDNRGGAFYFQAQSSSFTESVVEGNANDGFSQIHGAGTLVRGVRAERNNRHGIVFQYVSDFQILGCTANHNGQQASKFGWGICAGGGLPQFTQNHDFVISNNHCETNGSGGITIDPTLVGDRTPQSQRATVIGNVCRSDGSTGFNGVYVNGARDVSVVGNVCHDMPYGGIEINDSLYLVVVGNFSYGNKFGIAVENVPGDKPYGHFTIGPNMSYGNGTDLFVTDNTQVDTAVLEPRDYLALTASKMGFFGAPPAAQPDAYDVTNLSERRSYDADHVTPPLLAEVLGTLIADLKSLGILK